MSSSDILYIDSALTSDVFEVEMMSSRLLRSATDTIREDWRTCWMLVVSGLCCRSTCDGSDPPLLPGMEVKTDGETDVKAHLVLRGKMVIQVLDYRDIEPQMSKLLSTYNSHRAG